MVVRKIVKIDEEKCNGCGLCVPNCAEGAIKIIDGKARLVSDVYCDGLGACLGHCPQGAISIIEREADEFSEEVVKEAKKQKTETLPCGCPSTRVLKIERKKSKTEAEEKKTTPQQSELTQWPVQLQLVPANAPYLNDADILLAADCVPFACPDFHERLLKGKSVLVGCPKLDDAQSYIEKLAQVFRENNVRSVIVAHMEVPCCFGLRRIADEAIKISGRSIPLEDVTVKVDGSVRKNA